MRRRCARSWPTAGVSMANRNAAKGARWERAITLFLREWLGERAVIKPRQEGYIDKGDIHVSPFVIQAKDEAAHNFSGYVRDAEKQAEAAGEEYGVAVVKRRTVGPGLAYAVMTLATFRRVVVRLRRAEELLARYCPEVFHEIHLKEIEKER